MNWGQSLIVLKKEILDLLRDRKTWMTSVLLPLLLIPSLMILVAKMQAGTEVDAHTHIPIAVEGQQVQVEQAISGFNAIEIKQPADPKQALKNGDIRAIVQIEPGIDQKLKEHKPANVSILYDPSNQKSTIAQDVLKELLQGVGQQMMAERLAELKVPIEAVQPLAVQTVDASTDDQKAGSFLGFIVPLLLIVSCVTGAIPAATDLVAGEKERGTLEALLTTPVNGQSILVGKLITTSMMGFISAIASTIAMFAAAKIMPKVIGDSQMGDMNFSFLTVGDILLMLLVLCVLSIMFSSLMLCVSSFAKTFKEAQTYLAPFTIVAMVPVYATMFLTPHDIPLNYFFLPVLNATAMFKELLYGIVDVAHIVYVLGSTLVYATLAVLLAAKLFRRESLIVKG